MMLLCASFWPLLLVNAFAAAAQNGPNRLYPRQYALSQQHAISQQAVSDPLGATQKVQAMPHIGDVGHTSFATPKFGETQPDDANNRQVPWFDNGKFPFIQPEGASRDASGGLTWCPGNTTGFELRTDLFITSDEKSDIRAVQPYYVTSNCDARKVKRVILVLPGMPRDAWKWATLMKNVETYVMKQRKYGLQQGEVVIASPLVLNELDIAAGGAGGRNSNWAVYNNSHWEFGGTTIAPSLPHSVSFFTALDKLVDHFLDTDVFPQVRRVVIAGHSMGAQAAMRYALLRKSNPHQESKLSFWIGNPGSWAWLTDDRPTKWPNCPTKFNQWPYGLGDLGSMPKYYKHQHDQGRHRADFVSAFRGRTVHLAFGLNDNGGGDTHCPALYQGANHLDRGSHFVQMLNENGGLPRHFTVSYVAGVSHQDYPMFADQRSMDFMFSR